MKFTLAFTTTALLLLGTTASASADPEAAHALYPRGSLARAMLKPNPDWGKGAFGGAVGAIPASEAGMEVEAIVTVHSTVTITKTRGSKGKRDAAPTAAPVAKRGMGEGEHGSAHAHGHGHHHHHLHHHHQHHASEKTSSEIAAEHFEKSELTTAEEAKFLNDAFSLEMFKLGGSCNVKFGQAVCIDNKVSVCGIATAEWESVTDCTAARRRCGAAEKDDSILVSCMNITEVEYPKKRPSEKLHKDLRK